MGIDKSKHTFQIYLDYIGIVVVDAVIYHHTEGGRYGD